LFYDLRIAQISQNLFANEDVSSLRHTQLDRSLLRLRRSILTFN